MTTNFIILLCSYVVLFISFIILAKNNRKLYSINKDMIKNNYSLIDTINILKNQNQYLKMKADFLDKIMQEQEQQTISLNELRKN